MFVYAMLYAVAKRSGFEVSIDWPRGEELFGIKSRELDFTPTNRYEEKKGMVFDPEVFSQPDGTDFFGYFQSEKYFKECREDILRLFSPGEDVRVKVDRIFVEKARDARKTIVLGVRGKDYYTSFGWPVPGPTYYKEGLKIISEKDGIELSDYDLVCVTDDEKLGRRILKHIPNIDFLGESALVELFFMSRADRLIIPASSFHWWGAWLNNKPGKIVIAPSYWLNCAHKEPAVWWPRDIKCEGWVCVKPRQFMRSGRLVLWRNVSNSYIYKKMKNIAYRIKKLKAAGVRGWRYILEKIIAYILLQGRMFVSSNNYFAVTYANDRKTDGSGAQLQRIYGIYAVSRFLKCK